jgi:hypothetical protein
VTQRLALYRSFSSNETLLYIGKTMHFPARMRTHKKHAPWWVNIARIEVEWGFDSAEALDLAERRAIATEKPLYNVQLNRGPLPYSEDSDIAVLRARHKRLVQARDKISVEVAQVSKELDRRMRVIRDRLITEQERNRWAEEQLHWRTLLGKKRVLH